MVNHVGKWVIIGVHSDSGKFYIDYRDNTGNTVTNFVLPSFLLYEQKIDPDDVKVGAELEVSNYEQLASGRIKKAFEIDKIKLLK